MTMRSQLALIVVLAAVGNTPAASAPASATAPINGDESNGVQYQPTDGEERARETAAGATDRRAAAQDRELDQIGKQLLNGTPRAPAGSTDATGGGTTP